MADRDRVIPIYWRCSKLTCNPDGEQGWLREISRSAFIFEGDDSQGRMLCRIRVPYRGKLEYSPFTKTWNQVTPGQESLIPHSNPVLVFPDKPSTKQACTCVQNHASILYNRYKEPICLLGGVNLLAGRLEPTGWSCCTHSSQPPIPLSRGSGDGNWAGCPWRPHSSHDGAGPCVTCILVNDFRERLVFLHDILYERPGGSTGPKPFIALPHHYPNDYPDGPLKEDLMHKIGLHEMGLVYEVIGCVKRCLEPGLAARLNTVAYDYWAEPRALVQDMAAVIRAVRGAWKYH
ncbi:hypothetical protein MFIFM68171_08360 [Madurella fahalii]|uniref:Uncharacterized protein n=1 Tax=Madurella fahalii TaxID=1157608 RepID=A0ABQ0GKR2_9PEZI